MTPSLIPCAAEPCVENCSSNVDFKEVCLVSSRPEANKMQLRESNVSYSSLEREASPRITLRKRNMPDDQRGSSAVPPPVITSYNSNFLSGIFADIAKATALSEDSDYDEDYQPSDETLPNKKSRISLTKSISRCGRSYANLAAVSPTPDQGRRILDVRSCKIRNEDANKTQRVSRSKQDLHHCVSTTSNEENSHFNKLAFPHLPSSVNNEPTFSLTPTNRKGQQSPTAPETVVPSSNKDYGWFVEMDDDTDDECPATSGLTINAYNSTSQKSLAFLAPTAPKADERDAEVEWAKAADTVDDVLGDFF